MNINTEGYITPPSTQRRVLIRVNIGGMGTKILNAIKNNTQYIVSYNIFVPLRKTLRQASHDKIKNQGDFTKAKNDDGNSRARNGNLPIEP
jgi:hypothetical protein